MITRDRARKKRGRRRGEPVQAELELTPRTWGGRREGAGRRRDPQRHAPPHRARPTHTARYPVHVVLRTLPSVGRLRRGPGDHAIRRSLAHGAAREGVRIVHLSIQHNHVHLLAEVAPSAALSRGMQALSICAARAINRSLGRRGKVFAHRYHRTDITSPRQVRSALASVLGAREWTSRSPSRSIHPRARRCSAVADRRVGSLVAPRPRGGSPAIIDRVVHSRAPRAPRPEPASPRCRNQATGRSARGATPRTSSTMFGAAASPCRARTGRRPRC